MSEFDIFARVKPVSPSNPASSFEDFQMVETDQRQVQTPLGVNMATPQQKGFWGNVQDDFAKRRLETTDVIDDIANRRVGPIEGGVQLAGKAVAGPILDVLGEGVMAVGRDIGQGLSNIIPDKYEDSIKAFAKEGIDLVMSSDPGQAFLEFLGEGQEYMEDLRESDPQKARTIESAANIVLLGMPVKQKPKAAPTLSPLKLAEQVDKGIAKKRDRFLYELIRPKKTPTVGAKEALRTDVTGLGTKVTRPSPKELEIAAEVGKIKGVSSLRTYQSNLNLVQKANARLASRLEHDIAVSGKRISVPHALSVTEMNKVGQGYSKHSLMVGDAGKAAERVVAQAKELIRQQPPTPLGVFRARKAFDKWVDSQSGGAAILGGDILNARSIAVTDVRNAMNQIVHDTVKNTKVRDELWRQHLLFKGLENMAPRSALQANTVVGRSVQNVMKVLQTRDRFVQGLGAAAGLGALGASAAFAPIFSVGLVGAGAVVGGATLAMSPAGRKTASILLKAMDKAIRGTKNPAMVRQLRADKAALIELIENAEVTEDANQ